MQRCNNLTPLQRDNFVKVLTIFEVSSTEEQADQREKDELDTHVVRPRKSFNW